VSGELDGAPGVAALLARAAAAPGFMPDDEGRALYEAALTALPLGPVVEIGTYRGKSTLYLGAAARAVGGLVVTVDHHRGSEEHQPGEGYHDPGLVDPVLGLFDTTVEARRTVRAAGLDDVVVQVVGDSTTVAPLVRVPLGMVFIDGGHSRAAAEADLAAWRPKIAPGGLLAIHDVFPDPRDGGRPPYEIYLASLADPACTEEAAVGSLRLLRISRG